MANPFEVEVPNPLQALLLGQQSYNTGIENNKKQAIDSARQTAAQQYSAGNTKGAIATLMGLDPQSASPYINIDNNAWTRTHTEGRDKVSDAHQKFMESIALRQANRADDRTPTGFMADPNNRGGYVPVPNGPADPTYLARKAEAESGGLKPIPVDTIGGTKFLVRSGNGWTLADPAAMGQSAPQAPLQPSPPQTQPSAVPFVSSGGQPAATAPAPISQPQPQQATVAPIPAANIDSIDEKTGRREGYLKTLDPQIQDYIRKVADYEIDPRTTSIKGGLREKLLSAVAKYDPTYNQNDFGSRAKAIKDFSTGRQGDIVRSFDVAIDHLDTLQKAANALQNGNYRTLNELRNKWREQTGSELPTDFKALVPIVSGEIAKAVVGSQNALADREELRAGLKTSASPEQLSGVISGYKALMGGQLKGLRKQYEETTGKKNFDTRVRESTRKAILDEGAATKGNVVIDGYTIKEN